MYLPKSDWETLQSTYGQSILPLENAVVECRWDRKVGISGRWRFMRFRLDKDSANFINTAQNVQESIRDGVGKEELMSWATDIKAGWRMRHPKRTR